MTDTQIRRDIMRALKERAMSYPEIEAAIGQDSPYVLGTALCRLIEDWDISYTEPHTYATHYPLYHVGPLPKGTRFPMRQKSLAPSKARAETAYGIG